MVSSEKPSEPQPGKSLPPEIHSITFQLNDPNNPPDSPDVDQGFYFTKDFPLYNIEAGDKLFGFDKMETYKKSRHDLMAFIARWPKSCSTDAQLFFRCLE